jgi:hypothetical protein
MPIDNGPLEINWREQYKSYQSNARWQAEVFADDPTDDMRKSHRRGRRQTA